MKKIVSFLLATVLFVSLLPTEVFNVGASEETCPVMLSELSQLDRIINFAKSKIGSTEYVGRCQAFVYQCYKAGGIDNGSASSAIKAWQKWGVSTDKTNIPIGACVYFNEDVGSVYGHVGIYIGNNRMIHSRASVGQVVESSMTWYFNNCWLGWGWQGGVQPSSVPEGSTENTIKDYYKLTSPDGFQTMRESYSTSSNAIIDIPAGTYVCVTQYNSDRKWGYVSYNGYSGWIRLYYVETHTSHSWKTQYSCNETSHWKECALCGTEKDVTTHSFSNACDNMCDCGFTRTPPHSYNLEYSTDEDNHWIECSGCGKKKDERPHDFGEDRFCDICGHEKPYVLGDVNGGGGEPDTADAILICRYIAGYSDANFRLGLANYNGDSLVDTADAIAILRKVAGY